MDQAYNPFKKKKGYGTPRRRYDAKKPEWRVDLDAPFLPGRPLAKADPFCRWCKGHGVSWLGTVCVCVEHTKRVCSSPSIVVDEVSEPT